MIYYQSSYVPKIRIIKSSTEFDCSFCGKKRNHQFSVSFGFRMCLSHTEEIRDSIQELGIRGREEECISTIHENKTLWSGSFEDEDKTKYRCLIRYPDKTDILGKDHYDSKSEDIILRERCHVCNKDITDDDLILSVDKYRKKNSRSIRQSKLHTHVHCIGELRKAIMEIIENEHKAFSNII